MSRFYDEGLQFSCVSGCVYCCGVEPGYVFLSQVDLDRLCSHTKLSEAEFLQRYCRNVDMGAFQMVSLLEKPNNDCIFLEKHGCSVYEGRPIQCRTYPFWSSIVESKEAWDEEGLSCPGIGHGKRYSKKEIDDLLRQRIMNEPIMIQ
ncbi:MAG: YkgJ family cysteine cluster protein [Sphaerochaeta sp.]